MTDESGYIRVFLGRMVELLTSAKEISFSLNRLAEAQERIARAQERMAEIAETQDRTPSTFRTHN